MQCLAAMLLNKKNSQPSLYHFEKFCLPSFIYFQEADNLQLYYWTAFEKNQLRKGIVNRGLHDDVRRESSRDDF